MASFRTTSISLRDLIGLDGYIAFENLRDGTGDFGNINIHPPSAILHPKSVSDVSALITHVYGMGGTSNLTVAARGHGHSLRGQSQAYGGVVVMMEDLKSNRSPVVVVEGGGGGDVSVHAPYVDVAGGMLWVHVLEECLKYGLAPKSWTDYLYLSVGGTLSNAGVSGQALRHGPQISNVYQLEIVTGKGQVVVCSPENEEDLFFAALGGLGQFGIITGARIALELAPKKVRWIRVLYSEFSTFAKDQEMLIASTGGANGSGFDYMEGFVIKNRKGILNTWRSFLNPKDPVQASQYESDGKTLFCLELTKYLYPGSDSDADSQQIDDILSKLRYIPSTMFQSEVSYFDFLNRVHPAEIKLREKGLWDVPHPWLNLLVPSSYVHFFADEVFGNILTDSTNGPIIIYPVNRATWNERTSAVIPEEDAVFYMVAFLTSVTSKAGFANAMEQNDRILEFCLRSSIPVKQYLPHYTSEEDWKTHFGKKWDLLVERKFKYDPLAILAPGQRIFQRTLVEPTTHLLTTI
ncbi:UDP-N-acetylmuramate dehydrogenase, Cytokinin dehydrogenase [Zostera marina]|uniref:cytokinin dehydrogenase n=1 Tax=Zostera marina TaxID=29655 RepID=A0A0K9NJG1_ZOSMR|nr:UDP-N-acetylmuramate dehydrogenase, Cytokinin dehydrogenase [Zostera marina]